MQINKLISDKWTIYEVAGKDSLMNYLESLSASNYAGIVYLLEKIASEKLGPNCLSKKSCHAVFGGNEIFQFSKGRYRILWFYDGGKAIICTHIFMKKNQKTPKKEQKRAELAKKNYFDAKNSGKLKIVD